MTRLPKTKEGGLALVAATALAPGTGRRAGAGRASGPSRRRARRHLRDATNPDLSAFQASGGRLILHHGWSDTDISPLSTVAHHEAVRAQMGEEATEAFTRLHLFPGMDHCSQGEGPSEFDLLTPMMAWVEGGAAPDAVVAREPAQAEASGFGQFGAGGPPGAEGAAAPIPGSPAASRPAAEVARSRPVYPDPALPALAQGADPDDAASWTRGGATAAFVTPPWAGAGFFAPLKPLERP